MHIKELAVLGSNNTIIYIYGAILVAGGLIGILSSGFALKRYLKI